jgi:hypothetical protein
MLAMLSTLYPLAVVALIAVIPDIRFHIWPVEIPRDVLQQMISTEICSDL